MCPGEELATSVADHSDSWDLAPERTDTFSTSDTFTASELAHYWQKRAEDEENRRT